MLQQLLVCKPLEPLESARAHMGLSCLGQGGLGEAPTWELMDTPRPRDPAFSCQDQRNGLASG